MVSCKQHNYAYKWTELENICRIINNYAALRKIIKRAASQEPNQGINNSSNDNSNKIYQVMQLQDY